MLTAQPDSPTHSHSHLSRGHQFTPAAVKPEELHTGCELASVITGFNRIWENTTGGICIIIDKIKQ